MNLDKMLKCLTIGVALGIMSPGHACGAPETQAAEGVPAIFHKGARVLFQGDSITDGQRDVTRRNNHGKSGELDFA